MASRHSAISVYRNYMYLVPIKGFGLVYSVHKYGGCWRYYTLHMVDRYCNLVDTTLLHHNFALDI